MTSLLFGPLRLSSFSHRLIGRFKLPVIASHIMKDQKIETFSTASASNPARLHHLVNKSSKADGSISASKSPLFILHGLFGNASNWRSLAVKFADEGYDVYCLDLRNHGSSEHRESMDYVQMANDVLCFAHEHQISSFDLMGHSMGGKVAMAAALLDPNRIQRLCVLDIAPVTYSAGEANTTRSTMSKVLSAVDRFSLENLKSRRDADARMEQFIPELGLRHFLLQNLVRDEVHGHDHWKWRLNVEAIKQNISTLADFKLDSSQSMVYARPVLFIKGEKSRYIRDEHWPEISRYFPQARIQTIAGAGHWVHADQPNAFFVHAMDYLKPAA
eukprot:TRINITY_DN6701_c0_g1_i1.p1 TRINITY_DN6701_c0_g1~~TRINITY_DN6701_c0_g1_i1.p1  ORF type:complete len:330 (-),score=70.08 TRINITY_DN6701_c0_g1_i1:190-1179(-)